MVLHLVSPAGNGKLVSTVLKKVTLKVFPRMPTSSQAQARRRDNPSGSAPSGAGTRTYHPPVPSPPSSQVAEPLVPRVSPEGNPFPSDTAPPGQTEPITAPANPAVPDPGAGFLEELAAVQAEVCHWQDRHDAIEGQLATAHSRISALEHVYSPLLDRVKEIEEEVKDLKLREKSLLKNSSTKKEGGAKPIIGELGATPLPSSDEDGQSSYTDDMVEEVIRPEGMTKRKSLGDKVPGLVEIEAPRDEFVLAVSYRYYRLDNTSQTYNHRVASRLSRYTKALSHTIRARKFDGSEPIAVLEFLRSFRDACNHNGVSEAAAARLLPYFLEEPVVGDARNNLSLWEDEFIPLYPRLVAWLLDENATPRVLREAYLSVTSIRQNSDENEQTYGQRLRRAAVRTGGVFTDKQLKNLFVDGLLPAVRPLMTELASPQMTLTALQGLAVNVGETVRPSTQSVAKGTGGLSAGKAFPRAKPATRKTKTVSIVDEQADEHDDDDGGYYVSGEDHYLHPDSGDLLLAEDGSANMVDDMMSQASSSIAPPSRSWVSGSMPPPRPGPRYGLRPAENLPRVNPPACDICRGGGGGGGLSPAGGWGGARGGERVEGRGGGYLIKKTK